MICPNCASSLILAPGTILGRVETADQEVPWCGCGYRGEPQAPETDDQRLRRLWEAANQ